MNEIIEISKDSYIGLDQDNSVSYYEITGNSGRTSESVSETKESFDWESNLLEMGDYVVIPNGHNNDNPKIIQESFLKNSIAPRIQNRKVELLINQFPYLYKTEKGNRIPEDIPEITDWLDGFNYVDEIINGAQDYYYSNIVFTKLFLERSVRIGKGSFSKLKNESSFFCRLAYKKNDKRKIPTHVIIGDWNNSGDTKDFKVYPIFDYTDPYKHRISIHVAFRPTYGLKHYPLPEIFGAIEWIERNTSIPKILKHLTDNALNIKWHITSPQSYWDAKRDLLKEECKRKKKVYKEKMLVELKKEILSKITKLLSGVENVGKFWHNEKVTRILGGKAVEEGWEIKAIDQKIKDYVTAQLEIAIASTKFVLTALGLHSALANVGADGKSDSGSEQIYSVKIHENTSTRLPEYYVLKAHNDVIKLKFKTNTKLGFKKANITTEEETAPSRRLKNTTEQ